VNISGGWRWRIEQAGKALLHPPNGAARITPPEKPTKMVQTGSANQLCGIQRQADLVLGKQIIKHLGSMALERFMEKIPVTLNSLFVIKW
jgi:hypothetical protein